MMSLRVLKTTDAEREYYYNTLTHTTLPLDSDEATLRANYFMMDQDYDAIIYNLMRDRGLLNLTIVPTWECNLRCSHCSVTTKLQKVDNNEINTNKLIKFIRRYLNKFNSTHMSMHFVGGEPLLRQAKVKEIIESIYDELDGSSIACLISLTTNATVNLSSDAYKTFELLDKINVSIDGDEFQHNSQRRSLHQLGNPYNIAIENVKLMISKGFGDKLHIKAAIRDEWYNKDAYRNFLETMADIGVCLDNVMFGCLHPTDLKHDQSQLESFKKLFGVRPVATPCCKYRGNSVWLIDSSNDIYDLPYKWAQSRLGTIDEDLDIILERRRQMIIDTFPCFKDQKCMECPVLGFCWGQCVNSTPMVLDKPSNYCNQSKLINTIKELSDAGTLIDYVRSQSNTAIIDTYMK